MKTLLTLALVILIIAGILILFQGTIVPPTITEGPAITEEGKMQKFSSQEELEDYLQSSQAYGGSKLSFYRGTAISEATAGVAMTAAPSTDYSTTNIQVAGVDEADIVKNDGKYIYLVRQNKILILDAYPAESAQLLSEIQIDGYVNEIFINGNKLIVFGNERERYYPSPILAEEKPAAGVATSPLIAPDMYPGPYYQPRSFINVYDLSDKESPKLFRHIATEGSYYDSRMIDDYVYAIFNQPVYYSRDYPVPLPIILENGVERKLPATEIYHPFIPPVYNNQYTNIIALNVHDDDEADMNSFLIDSATMLFVSQDNIYLAGQKHIDYRFQELRIFDEAIIPSLPKEQQEKISDMKGSDKKDYEKYQDINTVMQEYMNKLSIEERTSLEKRIQEKTEAIYAEYAREAQKTVLHKIAIHKNVEYIAQGEVPGHILNQFSMDEHNGNLRVTTTTEPIFFAVRGPITVMTEQEQIDVQKNHLYVLDEQLNIIGKLEDLAPGERIYSTRFIEDRAYVVTFKKTDPLFVIDVGNPRQPRILGKLKIPGYSDYLHPYDETTIIGLGKEAVEAKQGDFALYQGVKLALFDVSDVANPQELAKYNIGDRGTDSEALHEHKAFLFSKNKHLLVLPITLAELKNRQHNEFEFGEYTFQGAYVFSVDKDSGIALRGRISHIDQEELLKSGSYPYFSNPVRRSLYIDDYLYTISDGFVKINALDTLNDIKTIELPKFDTYPVVYATGITETG